MRRTNIILSVPVLLSLTLTLANETLGAENKIDQVEVRLHHMEKQLDKMYDPTDSLNSPVSRLEKPVSGVNDQLDKLKNDVNELKQVVNVTSMLILCAILGVGLFVAVGIPIGVVIAWRYRGKILNKVDQLTPGHDPDPNVIDSGSSHSNTPVGPVISTR